MSAPHNQTHRFSLVEFYRIAELGLLRKDQRVELIDGVILEMMPIEDFHASVVDDLLDLFSTQQGDRYRLRVQGPLRLNEQSLVQPDLILLHPHEGGRRTQAPGPAEAYLVIEVSDSSLS